MVKKRGLPSVGELVLCKIVRINPNSAIALLEEYDVEGMIHISEISRGWVRDIRKHIKAGQLVIAKVIGVERRYVSLSMKRVDPSQEKQKMKDYKLNQKAEKMLEIASKEMKVSLDKAYETAGYPIQDNFGSLYEGFKLALKKPEALKEILTGEWVETLRRIAEKNLEQKEVEFKRKLVIKSYEPDGIDKIKKLLKEAEKMGLSVSYIAAPEYLIRYTTKDVKKGKKEFSEKLEKIAELASRSGVENAIEKMQ